jgi:DNA-binding NtrC family response regulator
MIATVIRKMPVLIVDDDRLANTRCEMALSHAGVPEVLACQEGQEALRLLEKTACAVAFIDLDMPGVGGEELLARLSQHHPDMPVIILTGANDVPTAVRCMQNGAFDYILKPIEDARVAAALARAYEVRELRCELELVKQHLLSGVVKSPEAFAAIITNNAQMKALFRYVEAISVTPRPVLITGETGTGKELMARAIHNLSGRKGPFISVNISGLDDTLFSDMLFGHVRGAFTGADRDHAGLIEQAAGGTLFLDEIGDLSMPSQIKLLRLLQEREYFPLGTNMPKKTDARIVVATLRDLEVAQKTGEFRGDLYYRLQTHRVHIPPLRERLDDLSLLVSCFLAGAARDLNKTQPTPPNGILDLLFSYHFPGNIRELESMVFDAVSNHRGKVMSLDVFKAHIARNRSLSGAGVFEEAAISQRTNEATLFGTLDTLPTIKGCTETLIAEALRRANNNQAVAASLLGIAPSSLNKRLKRNVQKLEPDAAAM